MYDLDTDEEAKIMYHIKKFLLYPSFWEDPTNKVPVTLKWKRRKFIDTNKKAIPKSKGVYAFVLIPTYHELFETRYLFYIGKTNRTLHERFGEYLRERDGKGKPRKKLFKMFKVYSKHLYFFYSEIPNVKDVNKTEDCLINSFVPFVNTQIQKARFKPELQYIYEQ
jgi:hypothetical protein